MKRVLGFFLGAGLGVVAAFILRRLWSDQATLPAPVSPPAPTPEKPSRTETSSQGTNSIRASSNTHPEVSGNGRVTRSTEPPAATETDAVAASPRSETFEPALPQSEVISQESEVKTEEPQAAVVNETAAFQETGQEEAKADFTPIRGIGEIFNAKLHEAGITSFEELAALTPQEIAEKTGIPEDRIERDQWHEQLKELTDNKKKTKSATEGKTGETNQAK